MKLRELLPEDLAACVAILRAAYNPPPWNDQWTEETGKKYLAEFLAQPNFIGYVAMDAAEIVGAMFAHRKTWWTNDEIFIDELFIKPERQRQGYGKLLLERAEELARELGLGGVTLLTNRYQPAKSFYEQNGYTAAEHVIFLYKEVR